ncbi:ankyrin repeat domain-containing protein, partial [candidate division CSSED10-310 bacterium]
LACRKGQLEIVEFLINSGADMTIGDRENSKPLHNAAAAGHKNVAQLLLTKGANINEQDDYGMTALLFAANWGHSDVFQLLMDKGADTTIKSKDGFGVLEMALQGGKEVIVQKLLDSGFKLDTSGKAGIASLHQATRRGHKSIVTLLLAQGIQVDAADEHGMTALHSAVFSDKTEIPTLLLKKGANINTSNSSGQTALFSALKYGKKQVAQFLINQGAQLDLAEQKGGRTALHIAAIKGYDKLSALMLNKGAQPDILDNNKKTPLQYAAQYGHQKTAQLFIKHGAKTVALPEKYSHSPQLLKELNDGEAVVWYLGHSGWAIKTRHHLLIFDYWENEVPPENAGLVNGYINPAELLGMKVTVFVSHEHRDHYDPKIFNWRKSLPSITYIFGFKPEKFNGLTFIGPRQKKQLNDLEVITITSNDSGVGFLVKVDGLSIFHAGDHANRKRDFSGPYAKEIDWIKEEALNLDIAFLPISGCGFGDQVAVKKGAHYAIKKLGPQITFPMHAGGWCEYRYFEFAQETEKVNLDTMMVGVENKGDHYVYKQGKTL